MLTLLKVDDFVTVDSVELAFQPGFTVFTGETGAGKSLLIEALSLVLGGRAEPKKQVRPGAEQAKVTAAFDLSELPIIQQWLRDKNLDSDGDCLLRRVIPLRGASHAWINSQPCLAQDLRALGEQLVDIYGQHAHQSLLRQETHAAWLDAWGEPLESTGLVRSAAERWHALHRQLSAQEAADGRQDAREDMLDYQIDELEELRLQDGECVDLERTERQLSTAQAAREAVEGAHALCEAEGGALEQVHHSVALLRHVADQHPELSNALQALTDATAQIDEAIRELSAYAEQLDENPGTLAEVHARLDQIYRLAQKHRIATDELPQRHRQLRDERDKLRDANAQRERLASALAQTESEYQQAAAALSGERQTRAPPWAQAVNALLAELSMPYCRVSVALHSRDGPPSQQGQDRVELMASTSADQEPKPLAKIVSGGELSRIGLAIQVAGSDVARNDSGAMSMVFDEVDVGVGGAPAAKIGSLLRTLGQNSQVFCVTHLAQIASQCSCHFQVNASIDAEGRRRLSVRELSAEDRTEELARMLAGAEVTDPARAHAKDLLISGR